jgi:hypothetical protein
MGDLDARMPGTVSPPSLLAVTDITPEVELHATFCERAHFPA